MLRPMIAPHSTMNTAIPARAKSKPTMVKPFFLFLRNKPMKHNRKPSPHNTRLTMLRIGTQQMMRPIKAKMKPAMPQPFFLFAIFSITIPLIRVGRNF